MKVDLVLHHGQIYTVDEYFTVAEAVAVKDGLIVAVGSNDTILRHFSAQTYRDLGGKSVYPGFIDAHAHLLRYGQSQFEVDLKGLKSWEACVAQMRNFSSSDQSNWLIGRGWDQNEWPGQAFPHKEALDAVFPDRPVLMERVDIHAIVVNSFALRLAGITSEIQVPGGQVVCERGKPTGLLIDKAQELVWSLVPSLSIEETDRYLVRAARDCLSVGLTGVGDALLDHATLIRIRELQQQEEFSLRVYGMLPTDEEHLEVYLSSGPQVHPWLHVGAFKLFADGTLGSRSAWLKEPYQDDPEQRGLFLLDDEAFHVSRKIFQHGFQLAVHAIGDAANEWVIGLFDKILPEENSRRWRIEHVQMLAPDQVSHFTRLNILPSIQPTHATSDMRWIESRIGTGRLPWAYRQQSLLEAAGKIALGSDFPVEGINPLAGFYSAITRQDQNGWPVEGFLPKEKLSREQAMRGMTIWAAYAQFEEAFKGSLEKGKVCDLVVLDRDPMQVRPEEVPNIKVLCTFSHGRLIYEA